LIWPQRYFLLTSAAIFGAGIALGNIIDGLPISATVATNPILSEFYVGTLIGFLFANGHYLPRLWAMAASGLGVAALVATGNVEALPWNRVMYWGLPSAGILFGAISLDRAGFGVARPLVALGDSSYSLYLTHPFVLPALGKLWLALRLNVGAPPVLLGLIAFSAALAFGHATYLLIEKPITGFLSHAVRQRPTKASYS